MDLMMDIVSSLCAAYVGLLACIIGFFISQRLERKMTEKTAMIAVAAVSVVSSIVFSISIIMILRPLCGYV